MCEFLFDFVEILKNSAYSVTTPNHTRCINTLTRLSLRNGEEKEVSRYLSQKNNQLSNFVIVYLRENEKVLKTA